MRQETTKLLKENTGSHLLDISLRNIFMDISLQARETKAKTNFWDYPQNKKKKLLHSKGSHQQSKKATAKWKKIFANNISEKGLISKVYKELIQLNTHTHTQKKTKQKQIIQFKNGQEDLKRHFSKENIQMANRHMKRCSSSSSGKCKSKLQWDITLHLSEWLKSTQHKKQQMLARIWKKKNPHALLVGMQTGEATVENNMEAPQKS